MPLSSIPTLYECIGTLATSKGFNCLQCHKPNAKYRCSKCGIAKYCSKECQQIDFDSHEKSCKEITSQLKECNDIGIVATSQISITTRIAHRSKWYKLLSILISESSRPSGRRNDLALELAYYIIHCMIHLDPNTHKPSILLLPQILIEMNLLDACYDFLKTVKLRKISKTSMENLNLFSKDKSDYCNSISEPIQIFCDKKCDPFLLLDLMYIKIQQKRRLHALQTLAYEFKHIEKDNFPKASKFLDKVAEYLGVCTKHWRRENVRILERQALDLVKLIFRISPILLQSLIQSAESFDQNVLNVMPVSVCLSFRQWGCDMDAITFLKQAIPSCR